MQSFLLHFYDLHKIIKVCVHSHIDISLFVKGNLVQYSLHLHTRETLNIHKLLFVYEPLVIC